MMCISECLDEFELSPARVTPTFLLSRLSVAYEFALDALQQIAILEFGVCEHAPPPQQTGVQIECVEPFLCYLKYYVPAGCPFGLAAREENMDQKLLA